jgi:hypothetical protein
VEKGKIIAANEGWDNSAGAARPIACENEQSGDEMAELLRA